VLKKTLSTSNPGFNGELTDKTQVRGEDFLKISLPIGRIVRERIQTHKGEEGKKGASCFSKREGEFKTFPKIREIGV